MRRVALALLGTVLVVLSSAPAAPAPGAYVGVGPSSSSSYGGHCHQHTVIALAPSALQPGKWAAEIDCAYAYPYNTYDLATGARSWPAHVASGLDGSPSTGFVESGTANEHGTSPGTIDWTLTIAPLGQATAWSLDYVFYPDPDYLGTGPQPGSWSGRADFVGASS